MPELKPLDGLNRRDLFLGASMLAMLGMRDATADAHTGPRIELIEPAPKA